MADRMRNAAGRPGKSHSVVLCKTNPEFYCRSVIKMSSAVLTMEHPGLLICVSAFFFRNIKSLFQLH